MNPHITKLRSSVALVIHEALEEIGNTEGAAVFLKALEAPDRRLDFIPPCFLCITVTPEVTQAIMTVIAAGQLEAYMGSEVDSQMLFHLVAQWQAELSTPHPQESKFLVETQLVYLLRDLIFAHCTLGEHARFVAAIQWGEVKLGSTGADHRIIHMTPEVLSIVERMLLANQNLTGLHGSGVSHEILAAQVQIWRLALGVLDEAAGLPNR